MSPPSYGPPIPQVPNAGLYYSINGVVCSVYDDTQNVFHDFGMDLSLITDPSSSVQTAVTKPRTLALCISSQSQIFEI